MAPPDEEEIEVSYKEIVASLKSEIVAGSVSPPISSPDVGEVRSVSVSRKNGNRKRRKTSISPDKLSSRKIAKNNSDFDEDERTGTVHLLGSNAGSPAPSTSTSAAAADNASTPTKSSRGSGAESPHSSSSTTGGAASQQQHKIRKLKLYSVEEKIDIIDYAKVIGNRAAGREFNVAESSIREWRKNEEKLRRQTETPISAGGTPRFEVAYPKLIGELDRDVVNYINRRRDDQTLDWYAIRDQARELWTRMAKDAAAAASLLDDAPPFSAADMTISMGWVARFMQRNETRVPKIPPPIVATANALANGTSATNNNNFNKPATTNNNNNNNNKNTPTTIANDRQPVSIMLQREFLPTISPSGSVENDTPTKATTSSSAKRAKRKSDADVSSAASINETISAILNGALGGIPPTNVSAAASISPTATSTANSRRKCHQPRRATDATLLTTTTELAIDGVASTSKTVSEETTNKRPPTAPSSANGARMPAIEQPLSFDNLLFGTNKTNTAATAFAMAFNAMMNSHNSNNNNNNNNNNGGANNNNNGGAAAIANNRMPPKAQPPNPIFPPALKGHHSSAAIQAMLSGLNQTALSGFNYFNGANSGATSTALNLSMTNNNKHNVNNNYNNNKHHNNRNGSYGSGSNNHNNNYNNVNNNGLNGVRKNISNHDSIGARSSSAVVDAATTAANSGNAEMTAFLLLKSYMSHFGISGNGTNATNGKL